MRNAILRSFVLAVALAAGGLAQEPVREDASAHGLPAGRAVPPAIIDDGSGTLGLEGLAYRARLRADRATFELPAPAGGGSGTALEWSFQGAWRGGIAVAGPGFAAPSVSRLQVAYSRDSLIERYAAGNASIEQSFFFAAPLPGAGDLVIRFAVSGGTFAAATGSPRHGALEFRSAGGGAIRYGEAFVIDHAGRRAEVLTGYDGAGALELVVPGAFLESATWPVVVDPVIGPVFNPGGPASNDVAPDVACDSQLGTHLVVWQRVFATDSDIRGVLYDGAGNPLSGLIAIDSNVAADSKEPAVAAMSGAGTLSANRFLVAWQDSTDGGATFAIRARLVDADDGALSAPAFTVSTPAAGTKDLRPDVAGGPPMLVAWSRLPAGAQRPTSIRGRTLSWSNLGMPANVALEPERILESITTGGVDNVRLAQSPLITTVAGFSWRVWRAVWQRFYPTPAPGDDDIRTLSFRTRSGGVTDYVTIHGPATVPGGGDVGVAEYAPDIAVMAPDAFAESAANYLVAWSDDGDIAGHRFDTAAALGAPITIRGGAALDYAPAVGAGACEFTVAYLEAGAGEFNLDVYAARVRADGSVGANHRLVDDPGAAYQEGLAASSRSLIYAPTAMRNECLLAWMGQTGPAGAGLNDIRARYYAPLTGTATLFGSVCAGPFGTLPTIGTTGGPPNPGNDAFAITLTNAPPFRPATLVLGTSPVSIPFPGTAGCFIYVGPEYFQIPTATNGAGEATVPIPVPCASSLESLFIAAQWGIEVPGFNAAGWITSNDLDFSWHE